MTTTTERSTTFACPRWCDHHDDSCPDATEFGVHVRQVLVARHARSRVRKRRRLRPARFTLGISRHRSAGGLVPSP